MAKESGFWAVTPEECGGVEGEGFKTISLAQTENKEDQKRKTLWLHEKIKPPVTHSYSYAAFHARDAKKNIQILNS